LSAIPESISVHPCYSAEAHWKYARMHLPVAPACNIQCRFCNRAFDCSNETRPGVTSKLLKAEEAAALVRRVRERLGNLSVVGIAGPGEPLANKETFETLRLVGGEFPDMTLCLATNGLLLPQRVDELVSLGVKYVTVTINALERRVGAEIYSWVRDGGETLTGQDAFQTLSDKQWEGLAKCVDEGLVVKVNSVLLPGINEKELPMIALRASEAGALVQNVIPFLPVKGSEFEGRKAPGRLDTKQAREECGRLIRQIEHCARCRADAIGLLGCDISARFY
jgi:nitrogen fixation protein NifB